MRTLPAAVVSVLAASLAAAVSGQEPAAPTMGSLTRIDDGLGGHLQFADGSSQSFHLEITAARARLAGEAAPAADAAGLAIGSDAERERLAQLRSWADAAFSPDEQKEVLAMPQLRSPRTEEEDRWHRRASLLRALHRYERVTRPRITKVFAGRGTVSTGLLLQLGDDAPTQILWRSFEDDAFAHMHFGTDVEPVALDSTTENDLLLAMRTWLGERLGSDDAMWSPLPDDTAPEVRLVATAWRGYLEATSPRLRTAGTIMDAGNRGSGIFRIGLARANVEVRFDHAGGTATPDRLREGWTRDGAVVELGSARERELLDLLHRAAERRRKWSKDPEHDSQLELLERELANYALAFPPAADTR